jgi:acyl-coenzyme A synthetase/AMP-(fatty) acid ligase
MACCALRLYVCLPITDAGVTTDCVLGVAAGLRCTFASTVSAARELALQYGDSGASLVFTAEGGIANVRAMFARLGIAQDEGDRRTIVMGRDLSWAGGPAVTLDPECRGLLTLPDLLIKGKLEREEQFEGPLAHETAYLCYSSGTTGKPKVTLWLLFSFKTPDGNFRESR